MASDIPPLLPDRVALIRRTGHVHPKWYLETYPDVAALGMDPAEHYLKYGARMGRNPGKTFDTRYYLETHPELVESGLNPLLHYATIGAARGDLVSEPSARRQVEREVEVIRANLLSHGLTDRALADLTRIAETHQEPEGRARAARELALWQMRQKTEEGYRSALEHIASAQADSDDLEMLCRLATIEIMCRYFLGECHAGLEAWHRAAEAGCVDEDVVLARINLENEVDTRVALINTVLDSFGIERIKLGADRSLHPYDRLTAETPPPVSEGPLITVLVAAYNAAETLPTALRSLEEQTWRNLEILVIDDASPDNGATARVVEDHAQRDPRIRLIRMSENGGAYVARNRGLDEATGVYVTLHDADDWSHPKKIEAQVRHLEDHPDVIGCTTNQARATSDLNFTRWTGRGQFLIGNTSSFMFRREVVKEHFGYWDTVRFSSDNELVRRIRGRFGAAAVTEMQTGPYSFQRDSDTSIIASGPLGINGFLFGVRKEYFDAQRLHRDSGGCLKYGTDSVERAFPVPTIMRPERRELNRGGRHFDIILAADLRWPGDGIAACIEEIAFARKHDLRIGIVEMYRYTVETKGPFRSPMLDEVRREIDGDVAQIIGYGEQVSCDLLKLRDPRILQDRQRYVPEIDAGTVAVIVDRPPANEAGQRDYDPATCAENVRHYFGKDALWFALNTLIRQTLDQQHASEMGAVALSADDWPDMIDIGAWTPTRLRGSRDLLRIGKYGPDSPEAWPPTADEIRAAYPERDDLEVHLMGGALTPEALLGEKPGNWFVHAAGAMPEPPFLAGIDVFVWFPNGKGTEAPLRPVLEAMAAGVPVILPETFQPLFGPAALYAAPGEVPDLAHSLHADPEAHAAKASRARKELECRFGSEMYRDRLRAVGVKVDVPVPTS